MTYHDRTAEVCGIVTEQLPGYPVGTVALLGEGADNVAYEVNGELIVRFAKEPDPGARIKRVNAEAGLLAVVADVSPVPVPTPAFTVAEQGCLAYHKLDGRPLIGLPIAQRVASGIVVAAALGEFLAALHSVPTDRIAELVGVDDEPLQRWLDEAAELYADVAPLVPPTYRPAVEAFLDAPPPADGTHTLAFSHNDLGIEHVLVDDTGSAVTGVIDWSDAALCDPAYDFGLLYRDLGPDALHAALRGYRTEAATARDLSGRAAFYARCSVLEDMAYGIEQGRREYLDKSLAALVWLFPGAEP
ncbi:phosphotransferase family protein [Catellatospora bangladeshensis]|uniref:Aminoglycoside phosphotransferase n=1 Tax=Catellatospora bangladeshensis TaxID=310355 RepID=A0A8J3NLL9_9ACTN|nr:phosphotransferase [Catellatospora bangladeshensis]GIF82670.1 aminoglycoside phosphotransferase [Catellatospora bangladeshensis]